MPAGAGGRLAGAEYPRALRHLSPSALQVFPGKPVTLDERGGAVQQAGREKDSLTAAWTQARLVKRGAPNPETAGRPAAAGKLFLKDLICLDLESVSLSCRMECR